MYRGNENMIQNKDVFCVKNGISLDELNGMMGQNYYTGCYVLDDKDKYIGIIGKKEYIESKSTGKVIVNFKSKYIMHNENEQKKAKEIFRNNAIKKIPVLSKNGKVLYEYIRDPLEETVEDLRLKGVKIGENVKIYDSFIDFPWGNLITIGNRVTISCSTILAHDASMQWGTGKVKIGKVTIKDDVFIGYRSIILPNVTIGNKVVIGAGTVVAKDVADNSVCLGNPMRIVGSWDEYMEKHRRQIESSPLYEFEYVKGERQFPSTIKNGMYSEMINGIGYVY